MKTKFFIVHFVVSFNFLYSQVLDWAPVGSKWYYEETSFGSSDFKYVLIESKKDTFISNRGCKLLQLNKVTGDLIAPLQSDSVFFTYKSNDSIYLFNKYQNSFQLAFVNNQNIGDSLNLSWYTKDLWNNFTTCYYKFIVDSINLITKNNINIREVVLKDKNHVRLRYYENIGCNILFSLFYIENQCVNFVLDGTFFRLRCYEHPTFGLFTFSDRQCDETSSIEHIFQYFNSVYYYGDHLYFKSSYFLSVPYKITVTDVMGRLVFQTMIWDNKSPIYLSIEERGIYFLRLIDNNHNQYLLKIIKSKV